MSDGKRCMHSKQRGDCDLLGTVTSQLQLLCGNGWSGEYPEAGRPVRKLSQCPRVGWCSGSREARGTLTGSLCIFPTGDLIIYGVSLKHATTTAIVQLSEHIARKRHPRPAVGETKNHTAQLHRYFMSLTM